MLPYILRDQVEELSVCFMMQKLILLALTFLGNKTLTYFSIIILS